MDTAAFLDYLRHLPSYKDQIVHLEDIPPRMARYGELQEPLHPTLAEFLSRAELLPLFSHQAEAINAIRRGGNVITATAAASGKSLIYNVPVLDAVLKEKPSRALYLFPTKALAQDQLRGLRALTEGSKDLHSVRIATFDGDTPYEERGEIRRSAQIVLTNPDMLHLGILPNHRQWSKFLRRLRYVVLDEAHVYRGVFGSHVANVIRRLRRICSFYGSAPLFILSTATIANPRELAEALVGLPFDVVQEDGSPYGGKDFVFWNPPIIDEAKKARRSANTEATFLFTELVGRGVRTLTFARTRRLTELIYVYARDHFAASSPALASRIKPYRAGYLPEDRREIERGLFEGRLLGVTATNALELGIDIGDLDATVLTGYPGSIASAWQQAGRSGRRGHRSLSLLIGVSNPLDQYYMRHPETFFGKPHEYALTSSGNPYILKPHLLCAAYEWPLSHRDGELFDGEFEDLVAQLEKEGLLRGREGRWYLTPDSTYPAEDVNIRSTSPENYVIIDDERGVVLETVESATAFYQIHPGAIYLHQGDSYLITELDIEGRIAHAKPTDVSYYTQTMDTTDIRIQMIKEEKRVGRTKAYLGEVEVSNEVVGFKRKAQITEEVISQEVLDLPPQIFPTVALWFDVPEEVLNKLRRADLDLPGGLHATEHAAIGMLPLFALCDRNDIGGLSTPIHPDTGRPQVFIYDGHPGGIGITEKGYELMEELWEATLKTIIECPCEDGCPSCIQSPKCGNNNEPLDKGAARTILEEILAK